MRKFVGLIVLSAVLAFGAGCGDDGSTGGTGGSGGTGGTGGSGGTGGTGGTGGGGDSLCTTAGQTVSLPGEISENVLLTNDCTYRVAQPVYVTGGTLTIEEGTRIIGDQASGLVVTRSGRIDAQGSANAPIVFTSSAPVGSRQPGDWGGVVLLGRAPLSWGDEACGGSTGVTCEGSIEGLDPSESRGKFGGTDAASNCGTLSYVRIEFAGYVFGEDNELNSLTLGGCGTGTTLEYIQAHQGEDDGVEFFGGTASISNFIVTATGDDGLDWDQGWQGEATNFIVDHTNPRSDDPRGIEGDNFGDNNDVEPRSNPTVTNGTLLGSTGTAAGIVLRRGTLGSLSGLVVADWTGPGVDVRDGGWDPAWPADLSVSDSCFWNNQPDYAIDDNDPNGDTPPAFFDEPTELADGLGNTIDQNPTITDRAAHDYAVGNSNCAGAFAPSGTDWTSGWTDYSVN
jgi:hypothetical protein